MKKIDYEKYYNEEILFQRTWSLPSVSYFFYQRRKLFLREFKNLEKKKKVLDILDVGCGDGGDLFELNNNSSGTHSFLGIEIKEGLTKLNNLYAGQMGVKNINFIKLNIVEKSWSKKINKKFDLIIFSEVFEHLYKEDQKRVLVEIKKLLKKDGILLITCPNKDSLIKKIFFHFKNTKQHKNVVKETWANTKPPEVNPHVGELSFKELKKLVVLQDFKIIDSGGLTAVYGNKFFDKYNIWFMIFILLNSIFPVIFPSKCFDQYFILKN